MKTLIAFIALCGIAAHLVVANAETLEENGYLADGENCTLIKLKKVVFNDQGKPSACGEPGLTEPGKD